jgi:hypothetical protein
MLKRRYPRAWRDTYACFIERCLELVKPGGRVGMLTMQSFMFTGAFEKLRRHIYDTAAIELIAHFGPGLFDLGNPGTLQTVATVMRREPDEAARAQQQVTALRLVEARDKQHATPPRFEIAQGELRRSPRGAWTYWLSDRHRAVWTNFPRLGQIAPPRQGLATTDNARFVRYGWEIEPTAPDAPRRATEHMWRPYVKSGRFRRWHESPRHRVNWLDDGREIKQAIVTRYPYLDGKWQWVAKNTSFYGRSGVTYSYLTSGRFSVRQLEAGAIFDVAGSSLFPDDPLTLLAVLNSSVAHDFLSAINPTVNFQVGDLAQLPVPPQGTDELRADVSRAIELQRRLDTFDETAAEFVAPMDWESAATLHRSIHEELRQAEARIEQQVQRLYGLHDSPDQRAEDLSFDQADLARRWVSHAVRRVLHRDHLVTARPLTDATLNAIRHELGSDTSVRAAREIESAVGGIERFVSTQFFDWHVKLYRGRPVVWLLGSEDRASLMLHDQATPAHVEQAIRLARLNRMPCNWDRHIDDGIRVNLAPLWRFVPHHSMQKALSEIDQDRLAGRLDWSATAGTKRASSGGCEASARRRWPAAVEPCT